MPSADARVLQAPAGGQVSPRFTRRAIVALTILTLSLRLMTATAAHDSGYGMITQELSPTEADTVERIGAGWVLLNFNWDWIDRGCASGADLPACRDYASLDAMVNAANARGLEIVADLSYTAAWANGTGIKQSPPTDLQDYYDFLFNIVVRYSPRVKVWKIWNEPNLSAFLTPADQWMARYRTYVVWAVAAIKKADPTAVIVGPDLSYHALSGGSLSEFNRIMTDYGWWAFDIVSVHHYDDDGVPLGVRLDEDVAPFRVGKPVWVTETGQRWTSLSQTFASQQQFYLRTLADYEDRRTWVTNLFFYQLAGGDLFNVTSDGSYANGFPALRSYEHWINLGRTVAFELAGIPPDDLNVGALDASRWSVGIASGQPDRSITVAQFGNQIHIGPLRTRAAGTHVNGVVSTQTFDLTGAIVSVRILTPPSVDSTAHATVTIVADALNQYLAHVQGGQLLFEEKTGGVTTALGAAPFSLTDTAYVRIRHDLAGDQIVFETATMAGGISRRAAARRQFDIHSMRLELGAGTSSSETSVPGTVVFDRVSLPVSAAAPTRDATLTAAGGTARSSG
jgi:polysaccharide biosynthesis protein PslG